ncbi:MAG TPA: ABC transporter substrate-binding protein [Bauldia sp.]|nr:ABC transporter substrate-binding protein [Bauldia sp.]
MAGLTITPGVLRVASAFPDPPFEVEPDTGFDAELMQRICAALGLKWQLVKYEGQDFNGIFEGLGRTYDAVISGTTVTPSRERAALFCAAYAEFNQGVAVSMARHPGVRSVADLKGMTVGIQRGNTSDAVARKLLGEGIIAGIRYYPYSAIRTALNDLAGGAIDAVIKLHPVLSELVRGHAGLSVVCEVPTHERIAIAVALGNAALRDGVNAAQEKIMADPWFAETKARWFSVMAGATE